MDVKHRFETGSPLEILFPGLRRPVLGAADYGVENAEGGRLPTVHGGMRVVLRCAYPGLEAGMFLRAHHSGVYNSQAG